MKTEYDKPDNLYTPDPPQHVNPLEDPKEDLKNHPVDADRNKDKTRGEKENEIEEEKKDKGDQI